MTRAFRPGYYGAKDDMVGEVRRFAKRAKQIAHARRLLAIAAVLDGASRAEAAISGRPANSDSACYRAAIIAATTRSGTRSPSKP
jgi:hypothetical protein